MTIKIREDVVWIRIVLLKIWKNAAP